MKQLLSLIACAGLLSGKSLAAEVSFDLNGNNTKITFVGSKTDGKHTGGFTTLKGAATVDGSDVATLKISVDIDMASTFTDDPKLTAHLKSPDFFAVKDNPKSKFVSTKVVKSDDGATVTGKLTLAGKTKEVTFPAKVEVKDGSLSLSSEFKINRNDWGISYGKGKINDEVILAVAITAKK